MKKTSFIIYYEEKEIAKNEDDNLDSLAIERFAKESNLGAKDSSNLGVEITTTPQISRQLPKKPKIKAVQQTGEWHSITKEE